MMEVYPGIDVMVGKTMASVVNSGDETLTFTADDGSVYRFYHEEDCCESVTIDDIVGDLSDLVGSPIVIAREDSNVPDKAKEDYAESYTWTFYNFATVKGYVTVKWYGTSNGYYSESVSFVQLEEANGVPA